MAVVVEAVVVDGVVVVLDGDVARTAANGDVTSWGDDCRRGVVPAAAPPPILPTSPSPSLALAK